MNLTRNTLTIRNPQNALLSVTHLYKSYVVGFDDPKLANLVISCLPQHPTLELKRNHWENVGLDVQKGLVALNVPIQQVPSSIVIDPEANIFFPRIKATDPIDSMDLVFTLDSVPTEEFLMLPFTRNLGIVIPYKLIDAAPGGYMCQANVVESAGLYDFREGL